MEINSRVKEIRQSLGLSQAKFAAKISISNGYIAGIELGNRKVNDRLIKLICSEFDVNENWFITGDGDMFNKTGDKNLKLVSKAFQELSPKYQEYVLKQINDLLKLQESTKEGE